MFGKLKEIAKEVATPILESTDTEENINTAET